MAGSWKDNRKIQFAVGATVIILAIRWLLTGDLLLAVEAARPPAEGETKNLSLVSVIVPMLIEGCVIVGVSAIAFWLRIWSFISDLVDQARGVTDGSLPVESAKLPESKDGLVNGLARAVATNDTAGEARYKTQIRKPYAISELNTALDEGDFDSASKLMTEIRALSGKAAE